MVSPNLIKKIPIAIGIKPSQPTTFTNKTIDCGPGNGNVISNLPNSSLQNSSLTINGVEIALGGTGIIDASGGSFTFVSSIIAGSGITVDQTTGDVVVSAIPATPQNLNDVLTEGNTTTQDIDSTGKILYSNVYSNTGDLPDAGIYHGMFAHVHGTGKGYFAHGGAWIQLLDTVSNIDELFNVNTAGVSAGNVLKYDGTEWVAGTDDSGSGGSGIALSDLSVFSNPAYGNGSLLYNSTSGVFTFTPADTSASGATDLDGLTDVAITTPSSGQVLKYNGTSWINDVDSTGGGGGATDVSSLTDVTLTSIQSGEVLKWNGTAWVNSSDLQGSSGGGNLVNRDSVTYQTTSAIASGAVENIDVSIAKSYVLMKVSTSHAAWVTFYTSDAARTSDASRTMQQDPAPGSGVLAEIITSSPSTQLITPAAFGFNDEFTVTSTAYLKVVNLDSASQQISGSITYLEIEGSSTNNSRTSANSGTGTIEASGANSSKDVTVSAAKSYLIQKIQTSAPAWVTVYTDTTSRNADASRLETVNPSPGSGVLAEVITTSSKLTQTITPGVMGFNDDATPSGNIYLKVVNKSGAQQSDIVVTVTYVQLGG